MISIEKLENTVKSLNITVIVLECFHILGGLITIFSYYTSLASLKNGNFEKLGYTAKQIEMIRKSTTPLLLTIGLVILVMGIIILVLAVKNLKAIKNKEYVSYLPYLLGGGLIIIILVNNFITSVRIGAGFSPLSFIIIAVYAIVYIATYLQAKKLNADG
ncbi:hypothetical protein ACVR0S_01090 [Streptococcus dentapri]|uniref:Uncharacterized protein n=1 Tax=Streptococcus dentapri TaxID=573564 RepID=A0ABV8D0M0_9STRE